MSIGEGRRFFLEIDSVLTEVLTVKQAAYHYNYSFRTIQKWIEEGKIIPIEFEGRNWIKKSDMESRILIR
jgi:predicted site-specific integrase-resolvase